MRLLRSADSNAGDGEVATPDLTKQWYEISPAGWHRQDLSVSAAGH